MREKIFAADIGNRSLKICVGEEDENGKITLLTKINKNIESFKDGEIIDLENFSNEVIQTLLDLAEQINEKPKNLLLSFSASYFSFQRTKGKISVSEKYINDEDIKKCHLIAKASLASGNYEVLFEQPIGYFLDGATVKVRDPLGMEARSLEVDFAVIQGLKASLSKIRDVFFQNNLKPLMILPNPLPASLLLLSKKDKEQGVILIDFGYKIFNLSIFQEGRLIYYQNFKFGFSDLLEDLAIDFGMNVDEIEKMILELPSSLEKKQNLKIKVKRQKHSYQQILKIIEKKLSYYWKKHNLYDFFKKLKESYKLPAGICLIGGGSYLPEVENIFKKQAGYLTKIGIDISSILTQEERVFANALGLIFYYQKLLPPKSFFENLIGLFRSLFH